MYYNIVPYNHIFPGYHGKSGPVKISDIKTTSLHEKFIQAGVELGLQEIDVNGESQIGKKTSEIIPGYALTILYPIRCYPDRCVKVDVLIKDVVH